VRYVPLDGELELLPGLRLVPAPGHTRGMQVVVVETSGRPVVVGGGVAFWFGELDEPHTGCARSTPSWSGSRTSTSRGDPTPSKASRRRSLGLPGSAPDVVSETLALTALVRLWRRSLVPG
jgi:hypothetical protein